jgi:hypothetical protein
MDVKIINGYWTVNKKQLIGCRVKELIYFNDYFRLIKKYESGDNNQEPMSHEEKENQKYRTKAKFVFYPFLAILLIILALIVDAKLKN